MIKLTIGKKTYQHPSKIEEVTLNQWINLMAVEADESLSDIENDLKGFSEFAEIPMKVLIASPKKDVLFHIHTVSNMLNEVGDIDLDKTIEKFKIGKYNYHVPKDFDKEDMGQYITCTHYMNKMGALETQSNEAHFLPYMLAIYCLRTGETEIQDADELETRANIMRRLCVVDAIRVKSFFLIISEDFRNDFQRYLGENPQTNKPKQDATT